MIACPIKNYSKKYSELIQFTSEELSDIKELDTLKTLIENKLKTLESEGVFSFSYLNSSNPENYDSSIVSLSERIHEVLSKEESIKTIYDELDIKDFIISKYSRQLSDNEVYIKEVLPEVTIVPIDLIDTISYNDEIKSIYGSDTAINDHRINIFNNRMRTLLIIDAVNDKIIDSVEDINNSIITYLEEQFDIVKKYLKQKGFNTNGIDIFRTNSYDVKELNNSYMNVMLMMYHYIHSQNNLNDLLLQSWMNLGTLSGDKGDLFHAINAYINVLYFDNILSENLDDYINTDNRLNSPIVVRNKDGILSTLYKYKPNSKDKFKGKNNWDDSILDSVNSLGKFQKVLISSIPIRNRNNPTEIYRLMLGKDFISSIGLLFHAATTMKSTDLTNPFKEAALLHRGLMLKSLKYMLEFMFDNSNKNVQKALLLRLSDKGIDTNILDLLYSIYITLFKGTDIASSWNEIELDYITAKGYSERIPIIDTLLGVGDSNVYILYLQTTFNRDEGKMETQVKSRISSDRNKFDLINGINHEVINRSNKLDILNTYKLEKLPDSRNYSITIGDFKFEISPVGVNILNKKAYLNFSKEVNDILDNLPDISSREKKLQLLKRSNLSQRELNFLKLLEFIDTMLSTDFSYTELGLTKLQFLLSLNSNSLKGILSSAARALIITDIYNLFETSKIPDTENYYTKNLLETFLKDYPNIFESKAILDLQGQRKKDYFKLTTEGSHLIVVKSGESWIDNYAKVEAILSGNSSVSVISNLEGDKIPVNSLSFLGAKIWLELDKSKKEDSSSSSLLFVKDSSPILNAVVNTDILVESGKKKSVKQATLPELLNDLIVNKFIVPYAKNNTIFVLPTVYSDKTKFIAYQIDLGSESSLGINIKTKEEDIISGLINTVGLSYKNVWNKVKEDYKKIFPQFVIDGELDLSSLQSWLKTHTEQDLITEANKVKVTVYRDTHFRKFKNKKLSINELLYEYAETLYTPENLNKRLLKEKLEFIKTLYQNRFKLNIKYDSNNKLDLSDDVTRLLKELTDDNIGNRTTEWVIGNRVILAKAKDTKGNVRNIDFGEVHEGEEVILNPLLNSYFLLDTYLGNNLRLSLTGSEINHKVKSLSYLNDKTIKVNDVDVLLSNLIFANFISKYSNSYKSSPDITFYDLKQAITTADLNNTLSDQEKLILSLLKEVYSREIYKIENAALNALFKRNVIIPGTMRYYLLNTLYGIRDKMHIAVIDDIEAKVFNFDGNSTGIDAHDGAAFINPLTSILENWSLQDSAVGTIKKPIHHWYDDRYMTATLLKYAVDTITNKWMRLSEGNSNGIRLRDIFKKMTNKQWELPIDLFRCDYSEEDYNFIRDILKGKSLYYKDGIAHNLILDFYLRDGVYVTKERLEVNRYGKFDTRYKPSEVVEYYHYFNKAGEHTKVLTPLSLEEIIEKELHTINSLFELHTALGGIYSESIGENGELEYSEASNYAVAHFMNYASVRRENATGDELTLSNYYQPLKEQMIDMLANNSSIKNGAGNVNSSKRFYNDEDFDYIVVGTLNYGILMDADHEADEGQMTEFSLVISSLDAGGRYHEYVSEIYDTLGQVALDLAKVELDAVADFQSTNNKTKLYVTVGKTIINNLAKNKSAGLAEAIFSAVEKEFNLNSNLDLAEAFIPFSDPNIYSTILSTFVSGLNKKSIKRKYPGQGTVMVPAYDLSMIYLVGESTYLYEDVLKLATESAKNLEYLSQYLDIALKNRDIVNWYLQTILDLQEFITIELFDPTDNVSIYYDLIDELGNIKEERLDISLNSINDYYNFKDNILAYLLTKGVLNALNVRFKKNITAPRNLAPAKISWEVNGKRMNIFDHWRIATLYKGLENIKLKLKTQEIDKDQAAAMETALRQHTDIQQAFDELDRGVYVDEEGNSYEISNLQNKAAEMITSNLFKTRFNIKEGDSLVDIKAKGALYFRDEYTKILSEYYDMSFTSRDGNDVCISFKPLPLKNDKLTYRNQKWDNTILVPLNHTSKKGVVDKIYYTTKDNIPLFEIGRRLLRDDVKFKNGLFVDKDSELAVPDQHKYLRYRGDQVVERVMFITKHNVVEKTNNNIKYPLYTILRSELARVFDESEYTQEQLTNHTKDLLYNNEIRSFIGGLLFDIYNSKDFSGININSEISVLSKNIMTGALKSLAHKLSYDNDLSQYVSDLSDLVYNGALKDGKIKILNPRISRLFNLYQDIVAKLRYASFLKSLYYTVSRIPALTLLSFMQMLNVGYTGVNNNLCFVSHWLTWLQGSDYDIDKAYIMGLSFSGDGRYVGWSSLFDRSTIDTITASEKLPLPKLRKYKFNKDGLDITDLILTISEIEEAIANTDNETLKNMYKVHRINRYNILIRTLNKINNRLEDGNYGVFWNHEKGSLVLDVVNQHESTKVPQNLLEDANKNFISSHIQNTVLNLRNMIGAYSPILMENLRYASLFSPKGEQASKLTLLNPATKMIMQRQNIVGKDVIGVAANGEKVSFMWHYWVNDIISKAQEENDLKYVRFNFLTSRIHNRFNGNPIDITIDTLPQTNLDNLSNKALNIFFLNKLTGNITVDLMISLVLSAATDSKF